MDRLTLRLRKDCITIEGAASFFNPKSKGALSKAIVKLADYEDTGLTPAEIATIKAERDAAVQVLKEVGSAYGYTCEICKHIRGTKDNPCYYPADVNIDLKTCQACDRCPCGHCDGVSQWEWRGLQPEQVIYKPEAKRE